MLRVESLDAMPLLWAIDDVLIALDRLPGLRSGTRRWPRPSRAVKNVDLKTNAMTVSGAVRAAGRSGGAGGAQGPADAPSAVPRHGDRRDGRRRRPSSSG